MGLGVYVGVNVGVGVDACVGVGVGDEAGLTVVSIGDGHLEIALLDTPVICDCTITPVAFQEHPHHIHYACYLHTNLSHIRFVNPIVVVSRSQDQRDDNCSQRS